MIPIQHLGVLLTARCNLTCKHCLQSRHYKHDLDPTLCRRLLGEAADLGVKCVSFSGGEPTLYPHLNEIVSSCLENGQKYSITTNGILYKPLLKAASIFPPSHVTISFEGANQETHERIRGIGNYNKSIKTASFLKAAGIHVRIQCTLLTTLLTELDELVSIMDQTGADELVIVPPVVTENLQNNEYDPNIKELIKVKAWVTRAQFNGMLVSLALGDSIICDNNNRALLPCQYMRDESIFVDWEGNLCLCCQTSGITPERNEVIGNLYQHPLATLLERRKHWMKNFIRNRGVGTSAIACSDCIKTLEAIGSL